MNTASKNLLVALQIAIRFCKLFLFFVSPAAFTFAEVLKMSLQAPDATVPFVVPSISKIKAFIETTMSSLGEQFRSYRDMAGETWDKYMATQPPTWSVQPYRLITMYGLYLEAGIYAWELIICIVLETGRRYNKLFRFSTPKTDKVKA